MSLEFGKEAVGLLTVGVRFGDWVVFFGTLLATLCLPLLKALAALHSKY